MPRSKAAVPDEDALPAHALDEDAPPKGARTRTARVSKVTGRPVGRPRKAAPRTTSGRIMSKAQMVDQVRDEFELYLTLGIAPWAMRDEVCGRAALEQAPAIADALASIAARNDKVLGKLVATGILADLAKLGAAALPVIQIAWAHHGPNGTGHKPAEELEADYAQRFPTYAGQ